MSADTFQTIHPVPKLARSRQELAELLAEARASGEKVGFVPTMGALHSGHASLMTEARSRVGEHGKVVVSIFVNPLQFAPGEDLDRYPRTLDADVELCGAHSVDIVFAPEPEEVYPGGVRAGETDERTTVEPGPLGSELEGITRPTHFRGVLTVVAKLFGLVRPDLAVFGQKDYQQLVLIRAMAQNLCMGIEVVGAETIREDDGLALSSRNRYLDEEQRTAAIALNRVLRAAREGAAYGLETALREARAELRSAHKVELDYLEIRLPDLAPVPEDVAPGTEARVLIAARVGTTRLIDNMPLVLGTSEQTSPSSAPEGDN